ncbi:MAG TPA: hypothetical protein VFV50_08275 [Bdellovibrionales bacterium]|nr:hypothetical protein [Bdellovibrionales bacterium]
MRLLLACTLVALAQAALAAPEAQGPKAKFKQGKDVNFDSQVVEGQIYRPDLSVVTGDTALGGFGALKLRDDFKDRVASENAEGAR